MPAQSEKEKMLAGEPYFANDPELAEERRAAQRLVAEYNALGAGVLAVGNPARIIREVG